MITSRAAVSSALADPIFAERYRIMCSRDTRFDGQFITGVHTTGIYCRPSCPATTPKPGNVSFYLTAAAAHDAGLRACKRCLPDAVPGSPAWNIRDDLAARAMRLISDGVVEREGVPGLATRLGYTPRHLTRVLVAELGAGPLALARAHRAQTARLLLLSSDLPITDVAFAAGFGSVRQFNDTVAAVYERTPSEVRAARRSTPERSVPGVDRAETKVTLQLPARAPFDGAGLLRFLGARALPGIETATDRSYARTVRLPHGTATIEVTLSGTDAAPALTCSIRLAQLTDLAPLVSRVRRLFDLDADASAIDHHLGTDPALAASVALTPGIRVPGSMDAEETLFRALIGQQISVAAARTALTRLADALGDELPGPDRRLLFPTSAQIAAGGRAILRGPAARIDTIVRVAEALASGELALSFGQTRAELETSLVALRGIGPWTAGYVAIRVLGSPDILLTSDLALRQGAERLGLAGAPRALAARGAQWAPWRSYAGMHLWRAAADSSLYSPSRPAEGWSTSQGNPGQGRLA
ncbi:AlkA N-terminal domain-containing protein [Cryobacterium sp. PH29-G1]|uniref:AlkA N-terminal domain-containing protein n=1 Tax=Cryobacterium sp. PH29-G1 TaxID=3046211 RepID=UPI0024BBB3F6|nr:AlkA N-terminal domain-containing protein [Cryobacterium sp. PH29-G1]MDJ0349378.1 AlkA N-terminal domain-containing protein [Cryobacterium sp. PH29-G1]